MQKLVSLDRLRSTVVSFGKPKHALAWSPVPVANLNLKEHVTRQEVGSEAGGLLMTNTRPTLNLLLLLLPHVYKHSFTLKVSGKSRSYLSPSAAVNDPPARQS